MLLSGCGVQVGANFLAKDDKMSVRVADVQQTLLQEMAEKSDRLLAIEGELTPMFRALPKLPSGSLEPATVRYALHRYFVQKHGWYISGLDPAIHAWNTSATTSVLKARAPGYIFSLFEEQLHGSGFGLRELSVFAAVLTDLIHNEAWTDLHAIYKGLQLPTTGRVAQFWSSKALKAYFVAYVVNVTATSLREIQVLEKELVDMYPGWSDTWMWVEDYTQVHEWITRSRRSPFVTKGQSFDDSVELVQTVGHHFGSYQNLECTKLKDRLVSMEHHGTGRVRLSRFYAGGLDGDWTFTETEAYLRNLGVLDEQDPQRPSVVIPNYLTSQNNCVTASGFYSVCCFNECEGLMKKLEAAIAAPESPPAHIVEVVAGLASDTVEAPRNLSAGAVTRLQQIAEFHSGLVPLHGRLFAQWMHHVYPRECPYPNVAGSTKPLSPDDWIWLNGAQIEATVDEMQKHYDSHDELEADAFAIPWTLDEELVAGFAETTSTGIKSRSSSLLTGLRAVCAASALLSFGWPLIRAAKQAFGSQVAEKSELLV